MLLGDAVHPMMPQLVTFGPLHAGTSARSFVPRAEEFGPGWLSSDRGRLKAIRHEPMAYEVKSPTMH